MYRFTLMPLYLYASIMRSLHLYAFTLRSPFTCMLLQLCSLYLFTFTLRSPMYAFTIRSPLPVCFYIEVPFTCMLFPWDPLYLNAFTPRFPLPVCFLRSSGWEPVLTEALSTVHPLCWYSPPAPPGSLSRCSSWPYPSSKSTPDGQTVTNSSLKMFKVTVDGWPNIIWLCLQWYGAKVVVSMINYQMTML